ncbi:hypothetical protein [Pseudooceanicola sediminis]|uniref:hypothetical protein n=1 Tax=Pseudooceanicola sediminis TaxID=2211117 RepID=UPI001314F0F5|nr:hypothetical protein [Pseudooceanicola sediminis]|tara:strand:- start:58336 stop:58500 length:165 start_codon:yes stop_codon:yes gene_type:complete
MPWSKFLLLLAAAVAFAGVTVWVASSFPQLAPVGMPILIGGVLLLRLAVNKKRR